MWKYRLFKVFNKHIHFHNIFINQIYQALFVSILNCFLCRDLFSSLFLYSSTCYLFHLLLSPLAPSSFSFWMRDRFLLAIHFQDRSGYSLERKNPFYRRSYFFLPKRQQLLGTFYFCKCKLLDISLDFCKSFLFEDFFALNKYKFVLFVFIVLLCVCFSLSFWSCIRFDFRWILYSVFFILLLFTFYSLSLILSLAKANKFSQNGCKKEVVTMYANCFVRSFAYSLFSWWILLCSDLLWTWQSFSEFSFQSTCSFQSQLPHAPQRL